MFQKVIAGTVAGFFVFVLLTSAWDYCHPDPDTLLFKGRVSLTDHQIKKEHRPCASLKDAYNVSSPARIFAVGRTSDSVHVSPSLFGTTFFKEGVTINGLSPPLENSPPLSVPLFQLHSNLRI